jgi:hypothetical protein
MLSPFREFPGEPVMHILTLFSLCFATFHEDAVNDAKGTVAFLRQKQQDFAGKPNATRLLYIIAEALRRYQPLAVWTGWMTSQKQTPKMLTQLYTFEIPRVTRGLSYTTEQLGGGRTVENEIFTWASTSVPQHSAIHDGDYHPGLKMFIILHTIAVVCRDDPTMQAARALAAKWLASLDVGKVKICEFIMIDVYRWANQARWNSYKIEADKFFIKLDIKDLWQAPSRSKYTRWLELVKLSDSNPWEHWHSKGLLHIEQFAYPAAPYANEESRQAVFHFFELFVEESVSYIRGIVATGSGIDNATHMIGWMEGMWGKVERLLADDDPIKVNVQNRIHEIIAELAERNAIPPPVDEGSSSSLSHSHGG